MTPDEARRTLVASLLENSKEATETARRERMLSPAAAINRAYFAVFYAASAVFVAEGRHFVKHAGLRSAVHRDLVKTGRLSPEVGREYDQLMEARHAADYAAAVKQTTERADAAIASAERLVEAMRRLLPVGMA